jgi:hypothetical protein
MGVVIETDAACRLSNLSSTPWQLAERLSDALARCGREQRRGARLELQTEINALRDRLARLFAERHGWKHSSAQFAPRVLARRGMHDGRGQYFETWPRHLADHPYVFRTPDRRAAALAAHLYGRPLAQQQEMRNWAAHNRLRVEFPTDFPSWWVPEATTLCVYLPAEEAYMSASA